jgi:tetratricopeptide (TPR) repeat protein/tRNA A-37 threonylcarbamoyl transferase component Bud32
MNPTIDILRGELERLFSLDEMTSMSQRLLGLDPEDVGGSTAKASFARALAERCVDGDRIDALVDVILASRPGADPRVRDVAGLFGKDEIPPGGTLGPFVVSRKLGESGLAIVYAAQRGDQERVLKVLRREAARDKRAVQRFLTSTRMVAALDHPGLPRGLEAGEDNGVYWVSYLWLDGQPLSARFSRTGPSHYDEIKPILRGILQPLVALHKARIAHGDLKLENVLVSRQPGQLGDTNTLVTLVDFGTDRLRHRSVGSNGRTAALAVFGSPKTIAPEQVRGQRADAATDVYAFGAMMYELISGKPVFPYETPTDAALAHVSKVPEPPSAKAPRGWVTKEVDQFVLSLLAKEPERRPKDASQVLGLFESLGRASAPPRASNLVFPEERLTSLIDLLLAAPDDAETAIALEKAIDDGAEATRVAEAFQFAAGGVVELSDEENEQNGERQQDREALEIKKSLLFRAARVFHMTVEDKERAETVYSEILALDPMDEIAQLTLDEIRKSLGKYGEVVESLIGRSQEAAPGEERARIFAEIGRLCANEIGDAEQGVLAYARALCETPMTHEYADDIEQLAEAKAELWNEVLATVAEGTSAESLSSTERNKLLLYGARWYEQKLARPDVALHGYQQILASEPAHEEAHEALAVLYRKAQQWPELVAALLARVDAAGGSPRARDVRAEAAEVYEQKLNDDPRAKELYAQVLSEDPSHVRAVDGMARIAERTRDFHALVVVLERRAEWRRGREKADALLKVAQVYEENLEDLPEAARRYETVLGIDPHDLQALKGLDRIYEHTGKYRELLDNLEQQAAIAATPRQKINLLERMATLHEHEFLSHAKAAECLEQILAIDATNEAALSAVPRHYRALQEWELLEKLYEHHAKVVADEAQRVEITLQRARLLADNMGSPDRAMRVYEQVLELRPMHGGALEALARLREQAGDAAAALSAIEALAGQGATPAARAELWIRAARLVQGRGDLDGAIDRYKQALEADPTDGTASLALRQAYAARGEASSVVALIEKELALAEGKIAKARLFAELARVQHDNLRQSDAAETNAKAALDMDPTNADALLVLGDLAYDGKRYIEASKYLEPLVSRAPSLPADDAVRVLMRFVEAYGRSVAERVSLPPSERGGRESWVPPPASVAQEHPRLAAAVEALNDVASDDVDTLSRVGRVLFECGDIQAARVMYERLLDHRDDLPHALYAEALWRLGEALRQNGELEKAHDLLRQAADVDPGSPGPLQALGRVYEQTGDWDELIRTKLRRLEVAEGDERFDLLLQIGDIEFGKLNDRGRASKTYVTALEERPDDRKLLTKLMQLYSEEKDWANLVEVVLRLADFVDDPKQRAKYLHTAAIVSSRQLGETDQAIVFYERALEFDPTLTKAMDEAIALRRQTGDHEGVERLLKVQLEQAKEQQDRVKIVEILDRLGDLYNTGLNEPELAIDAYEAAQAFEPEDKHRSEILAELYASNVTQYLDKAVRAQAQILRRNPYRLDSYKLLRRLYTEARKPDPAWCVCQALAVLNRAEPDEERFYRRHRAETAASAQEALDEEDWTRRLAHPEADPLVTRVFAAIQPTIIRARTQPLEALGYDERNRIDLNTQPFPVIQTLYYVQCIFGFEAPPVFQNENDPTGLGFLHAHVPSIVLGRAAYESDVPTQSLAFVAGRHMAYFRPGYYVRHLVPTGTGLKAWLFAAIKLCVPQFPIAPEIEGQVEDAIGLMAQDFHGVQREVLASTVSKLLQSGGAIDLKKWVTAIDLTADRAGFLLAHDLQSATDVMRATEDASSVPPKERIKEIVLFSISEEYLALRQKLRITIDS